MDELGVLRVIEERLQARDVYLTATIEPLVWQRDLVRQQLGLLAQVVELEERRSGVPLVQPGRVEALHAIEAGPPPQPVEARSAADDASIDLDLSPDSNEAPASHADVVPGPAAWPEEDAGVDDLLRRIRAV